MKVNICGLPHEVIEVEDKFNMDCHMGMIEYKDLIIKINKDMPAIAKEETLCHEMVHGMLIHLGYAELSDDERFVQALGNAIFQGFEVKEIKDNYNDLPPFEPLEYNSCEKCKYYALSNNDDPCKHCRHNYNDKFTAKIEK